MADIQNEHMPTCMEIPKPCVGIDHLNQDAAFMEMQTISGEDALASLSTRIRNSLQRVGIQTVEQLLLLSEEDLYNVRNLGPESIEHIRNFISEQGSALATRKLSMHDYEPFLPQLDIAFKDSILTNVSLSNRAKNALIRLQVTSNAGFVLISPFEIQSLYSIGSVTLHQLITFRNELAQRYGLESIAGTTTVQATQVLCNTLAERAKREPYGNADTLNEYVRVIQAEIGEGRLASDATISNIASDAKSSLTVQAFLHSLPPGSGWQDTTSSWHSRTVKALAQALLVRTVDEEVNSLLSRLSERQLAILRYRFDPFVEMTLDQIGQILSVTRERVRQIQEKVKRHLLNSCEQDNLLRMRSAIEFSLAIIEEGGGLREIEDDLGEKGLINEEATFRDLLVIWNAINLESPFPRELITSANEGLTPRQAEVRKEIRREAATLCRNSGALRLNWLTATAGIHDIRTALFSMGYEEIVPEWYWRYTKSKNVVESVARKIFSVTSVVSPRDFRRSMMKHLSRRSFATPPTDVLREVVSRLTFVHWDGESLSTNERFSPENELVGSEFALFRYLSANGPIATFQELYEANRKAGYQTITLAVRLKQSPVIRRVKRGLYTLVGSQFTQQDIDHALNRTEDIPANGEIRYNMDGTVTYFVNARPWLLYGGVLSSPELGSFAGEWYTTLDRMVTISSPNSWGFGETIEHLDLEIGERIALELDTRNRVVTVKRAVDYG